ncbi:GTP cyclohydrolase II [Aquimarina mytili]|uniref:GTP cyclohydrolase n=1 Tax=Aquimarina mytili TaxID=874423 RepID=A0A937D5P4_9FLAO|nr:GTP cyclohydrolase [Aquimarina mytili]MBL0683529.1 GTP cyclohydrolase [Aquimarina mytili]
MIIQLAETELKTKFGDYKEILFYDGQKESHALVMGALENEENVLCRVHSSCIFAHHFNSIECDCREQMEISQQLIQKEGKGIIIWLDQEGKGNGHYALLKSIEHKKAGLSQAEAYEAAGFKKDARDFAQAAKILKHIGIASIQMLTNNPKKVETLTQYGISVAGTKPTVLNNP